MNMKKIVGLFVLSMVIISCISCTNFSNIKKEDLCGKRYTSSVPSPIAQGVSSDTGTTLKCDGTFESGEVTRMVGQNSVNEHHFTGTWEIVKEISEDVKSDVKRYGINHDNYLIIKYSSDNGVTGYCVYYPSSFDSSPTLAVLNFSSDDSDAGIYGGSPEKNNM
jgi:hypothetical protein